MTCRSFGPSTVASSMAREATHPLIEDIKRKDFVASRAIDDATVLGPKLRQVIVEDLRRLAPFNDYLCAALGLEF